MTVCICMKEYREGRRKSTIAYIVENIELLYNWANVVWILVGRYKSSSMMRWSVVLRVVLFLVLHFSGIQTHIRQPFVKGE